MFYDVQEALGRYKISLWVVRLVGTDYVRGACTASRWQGWVIFAAWTCTVGHLEQGSMSCSGWAVAAFLIDKAERLNF